MNSIDPYYKKTVQYKLDRYDFQFNVSQDLFSSLEVDHGTQRLLRTLLFEQIMQYKKVLDLGCGYGPIGIVMKKMYPQAEVQMVDRDALAVAYAKENAELNNISENLFCYGSLGYDNVKDTDFDVIVSNIPAKVGEQVLTHMIKDAKYHLAKNGKVIIVVIDAINDYINKELTADETINILYHKSWPGHHVYHYTFTEAADTENPMPQKAFEKGEYSRQRNSFTFHGEQITLETTYHLAEYDQLSFDSQLLLSQLEQLDHKFSDILIFNPGQGYIPVAAAKQYTPHHLMLVDRDLQALTISQKNLIIHGYPKENIHIYHQVGLEVENSTVDAIIGVMPKKQELAVYDMFLEQAYTMLNPQGYFILTSTSTVITRIVSLASKKSRFKVVERIKDKGRSIMIMKKNLKQRD